MDGAETFVEMVASRSFAEMGLKPTVRESGPADWLEHGKSDALNFNSEIGRFRIEVGV